MANTNVVYETFVSAINLYPPWLRNKDMHWAMHMDKVKKTVRALRKVLRRDRRIHEIIAHESFMVAPEQWPEGVWTGILVEPPTPYEMATFTLKPPPYIKPRILKVSLCDRTVLYWWLMGAGTGRIEEVLGIEPIAAMRRAIQGYMKVPAAQLWFIATNPLPMCRNRYQAQAVINTFQGVPQPPKPNRAEKDAIAKVVATPYFRAQLTTGRPLAPVERPLYAPEIVWRSLAHKEEDYIQNPEFRRKVQYHQFEQYILQKKNPSRQGIPEGLDAEQR